MRYSLQKIYLLLIGTTLFIQYVFRPLSHCWRIPGNSNSHIKQKTLPTSPDSVSGSCLFSYHTSKSVFKNSVSILNLLKKIRYFKYISYILCIAIQFYNVYSEIKNDIKILNKIKGTRCGFVVKHY